MWILACGRRDLHEEKRWTFLCLLTKVECIEYRSFLFSMRKTEQSEIPTPEQLEKLSLRNLEAIARETIARARKVLRRAEQLPEELNRALYDIRDAYNDALEARVRQKEGDPALFVAFKQVLGEVYRPKQTGRHWGTYRNYLKEGDNPRGTNKNFYGKP